MKTLSYFCNMKKIVYMIAGFLWLVPTISIFSEGKVWVNFAGLGYIVISGYLFRNTRIGRNILAGYYKSMR